MSEPTDNLTKVLTQKMIDEFYGIENYVMSSSLTLDRFTRSAKAAVAAYRAHPDGAAKDWLAGRDAAADEIDCGCEFRKQSVASNKHNRYNFCQQGECLGRLAADVRTLQPPTL